MVEKSKLILIGVASFVAVLILVSVLVATLVDWDAEDPPSEQPTLGTDTGPKIIRPLNSSAQIKDEWLVITEPNSAIQDEIQQELENANMPWSIGARYANIGVMQMTCPEEVLNQAVAMGSMRRNARYVEAEQIIQANQAGLWGLDRIDQRNLPVDGNFLPGQNGAGVNVYVLDTGIRRTHSDFGGRVGTGMNFAGGISQDGNGHGTHCAGTIGGAIHGVAKGVNLHPIRVLNDQGSGTTSGIVDGLNWLAQNAAKPAVASMSLGGGASAAIDNAVANLKNSGVTVVVAAGNDNRDSCQYSPARSTSAITVGSSDPADQRSSFSNFGTCTDIFAPGSGVLSTWFTSDTATATLSGTSMACPHVAGVAALYLQLNPQATPDQVRTYLLSQATTDRLTLIGAGSPSRLLYTPSGGTQTPPISPPVPDPTPPVPEPPCTSCAVRTGQLQRTGQLLSIGPKEEFFYYFAKTDGVHKAVLNGAPGTDFDLFLFKLVNGGWATVRKAESPTSTETMEYAGGPGFYTWGVYSYGGQGQWVLELDLPEFQ